MHPGSSPGNAPPPPPGLDGRELVRNFVSDGIRAGQGRDRLFEAAVAENARLGRPADVYEVLVWCFESAGPDQLADARAHLLRLVREEARVRAERMAKYDRDRVVCRTPEQARKARAGQRLARELLEHAEQVRPALMRMLGADIGEAVAEAVDAVLAWQKGGRP